MNLLNHKIFSVSVRQYSIYIEDVDINRKMLLCSIKGNSVILSLVCINPILSITCL